MQTRPQHQREAGHDIAQMFLDRWSPRSFSSQPVTEETLLSLFEAGRWAPSCFNEQPWVFYYAYTQEQRQKFIAVLAEKNQIWAKNAAAFVFVVAKKNFSLNAKPNRHAAFDAGAAWMSLALQARESGLYAHAMAGFDLDKAYDLLQLSPQSDDILAAVAVGYIGPASDLPEDLRKMEAPNTRKDLGQIIKQI